MANAIHMYGQDYDEQLFPYRFNYPNGSNVGVSAGSPNIIFFNQLLHPYTKNWDIWKCSSRPGAWVNAGYGGQNSFGVNKYAFNIASSGGVGISFAEMQTPSNLAIIVDTTYYDTMPKYTDRNGARVCQGVLRGDPRQFNPTTTGYNTRWKIIGNAEFDAVDAAAIAKGKARHQNIINVVFADGHAKGIQYERLIYDLLDNPNTSMWDPWQQGIAR
jgi:prepilin-type processing-associated H-X9-DG protein